MNLLKVTVMMLAWGAAQLPPGGSVTGTIRLREVARRSQLEKL